MPTEYVVCCPVCDEAMQERGYADCWYCAACDARYRFNQALLTIDGRPNYEWTLLFPESCPLCKDAMHVAHTTHDGIDIWRCMNCDEAFTDAELYQQVGQEVIHV